MYAYFPSLRLAKISFLHLNTSFIVSLALLLIFLSLHSAADNAAKALSFKYLSAL